MSVPIPAESRRWHNVTVVRERDTRRSRWVLWVLLGALAAAAPVAAYLIQQMQYVEARHRIEEQRSRLQRLEEAERRLRIERATLETPPRVETRAKDELGLIHPKSDQVEVVRSSAPVRGNASPRSPGEFRAAR